MYSTGSFEFYLCSCIGTHRDNIRVDTTAYEADHGYDNYKYAMSKSQKLGLMRMLSIITMPLSNKYLYMKCFLPDI